jgi:hypothetical protein
MQPFRISVMTDGKKHEYRGTPEAHARAQDARRKEQQQRQRQGC